MEKNINKIVIAIVGGSVLFIILMGIIIAFCSSEESIKTNGSSYTGGSTYSGESSYSGGSSYSGSSSSGSSSYKSKDPADYDSKGNYKPVETMTQEEKRQELLDMLEDSLY